MQFIFLDTETTGTEAKDRLCQLAYIRGQEKINELFKPPLKITPEASAVTHITNKMVAEKEEFATSDTAMKLQEYVKNGDIIVAHNAKFDIAMLEKEGLMIPKYICTLKLARYLDEKAVLKNYQLQYLRYLLEIEVEVQAHDAMGDVIVLEQVFNRIENKVREQTEDGEHTDGGLIEHMIQISMNPVEIRRLTFGKFEGKLVSEIATTSEGKSWLMWWQRTLLEKPKEEQDEDWLFTLKKYL